MYNETDSCATPSEHVAQDKPASAGASHALTTPGFFDVVLPSTGRRCAGQRDSKGKFSNSFVGDNAALATEVTSIDIAGHDAYFAMGGYGPLNERKQPNVVALRCFWLDLDVGPEKGYATREEALKALRDFRKDLKLPTPWIVLSGYGVHVHFPTDADIMPAEWKRTAKLLKRACRKWGLYADPKRTCDEASVLRPIGTSNRKNGGAKPVKLLHTGKITAHAAIHQRLVDYLGEDAAHEDDLQGEPARRPDDVDNSDLSAGVEYRPSDAHKIADECKVIGEIRDTRGKVEEPLWRDGLGVVAYTIQGDEICHEWSKGDPRYTYAETQSKIDRFRANATGPTKCETLSDYRPDVCAACPHWGKIKSPISSGMIESLPAATSGAAQGGDSAVAVRMRPTINYSGSGLAQLSAFAATMLVQVGAEIYQQGGRLVQAVSVESIDSKGQRVSTLGLKAVENITMRCILSEHFDGRKGDTPSNPPKDVADAVLNTQVSAFKPLAGIFSCPTIRHDGSVILLGKRCPAIAASRDAQETEKKLTAEALSGSPITNIDNVNGELGSDLLCQMVSQVALTLRPLGSSQQVTVSNRSSIYFSGNNVTPRADLNRRVLISDLDRKTERPEAHKFASDPVKAVLTDRGKYVAAVLTVCRAYIQAGKPDQGLEPLSGFDEWSEMVRSPLVWLGEADPVDTLKAARENDPDAETLAQFLNAAKKHISGAANARTAAEIVAIGQNGSLIGSGAPIGHDLELQAAIEAICGGSQRVSASVLGRKLREYVNRVCGGLRLEGRKNRLKLTEWYVVK
jgi:hypothetical protein